MILKLSTYLNSLGTPESQGMDVSMKRTIIEESPFSTPGQSLSKRASKLEITGSPAKKNFHPVFTKQTKPVSKYLTEIIVKMLCRKENLIRISLFCPFF